MLFNKFKLCALATGACLLQGTYAAPPAFALEATTELRIVDREARQNIRVLPDLISGEQSRIAAQSGNRRDAIRVEITSGGLLIAGVAIPFIPITAGSIGLGLLFMGFSATYFGVAPVALLSGLGQNHVSDASFDQVHQAFSTLSLGGHLSTIDLIYGCSHAFRSFDQAQHELDQVGAEFERTSPRGVWGAIRNGFSLGSSDANYVAGVLEVAKIQSDLFKSELVISKKCHEAIGQTLHRS